MITSIELFMAEVDAYFRNGFPSEKAEELFAAKLAYVKPNSLQRLFDRLIETFPATFTPDVKALKDAIDACGIILMEDPEDIKQCPVCKTRWTTTGLCPVCLYDREKDGTPEQHRAWYEAWKRGEEPRFDVGGMLSKLAQAKTLPDSDK